MKVKKKRGGIVRMMMGVGIGLAAMGMALAAGCLWFEKRGEWQSLVAVIIPHHLLALDLIEESLEVVEGREEVTTIVLISPDHFSQARRGSLVMTDEREETEDFFRKLKLGKKVLVQKKTAAINLEHGLRGVEPIVREYFPRAEIILLGVTNHLEKETELELLGRQIGKLIGKGERVLIIISSDFAHYTTDELAQENDKKSVLALEELAVGSIDYREKIDNDCQNCWVVLDGFLNQFKDCHFNLINNQNSTNFGGEDRNVTSYVTGNFSCGGR